MKATKFADAQKAFIIRQGEEGAPVAEICRKAGMMPSQMKRLRELEDENNRLKRIVADPSLDKGCCRTSSAESFKTRSPPPAH